MDLPIFKLTRFETSKVLHLYKRVCPSVHPFVHPLVRQLVRCKNRWKWRNTGWGRILCRVYGLVLSIFSWKMCSQTTQTAGMNYNLKKHTAKENDKWKKYTKNVKLERMTLLRISPHTARKLRANGQPVVSGAFWRTYFQKRVFLHKKCSQCQ